MHVDEGNSLTGPDTRSIHKTICTVWRLKGKGQNWCDSLKCLLFSRGSELTLDDYSIFFILFFTGTFCHVGPKRKQGLTTATVSEASVSNYFRCIRPKIVKKLKMKSE